MVRMFNLGETNNFNRIGLVLNFLSQSTTGTTATLTMKIRGDYTHTNTKSGLAIL